MVCKQEITVTTAFLHSAVTGGGRAIIGFLSSDTLYVTSCKLNVRIHKKADVAGRGAASGHSSSESGFITAEIVNATTYINI